MNTLDRIKDLAKKRDLSINQLESELGFARGYLYSWKKKTPGVDKVQAIATFFNVSVDYLLGNTNDPNPSPKGGSGKVDLSKTNIFSYRGDEMNVDGIDPDDWEIIKAVLARRQKREDGK